MAGSRLRIQLTDDQQKQISDATGKSVTGSRLTIRLTDDQQKQIKDATGKSVTELTVGSGAAERGTR